MDRTPTRKLNFIVNQDMNERDKLFDKVTRFEVIDEKGRSYVMYNITQILYSIQDNGRTLKLFINSMKT